MIFIDTETTGLSAERDEILEVCVMDSAGGVLYNQRFRPEKVEAWPAAEAVNHISPADVENCTPFRHSQEADEVIRELMPAGVVVAGWNVKFDIDFIRAGGVDIPMIQIEDVMRLYADLYGEIMPDGRRKWSKLTEAAQNIGYQLPEGYKPHSAAGDCMLTRAVYRYVKTWWNALYNEGHRESILGLRECMERIQRELHRIHTMIAMQTVIEQDNTQHIRNLRGASFELEMHAEKLHKLADWMEESMIEEGSKWQDLS